MAIVFGTDRPDLQLDAAGVGQLLATARERAARLARTPLARILDVLAATGRAWQVGGELHRRALAELQAEVPFSPAMIAETLAIVPALLDRDTLAQRVTAELGSTAVLDGQAALPGFAGTVRAFPVGTVLHVAAGNVFIGCIDSLVMGFLTKNVSIVKLSSKNQLFPLLFAASLRDADPEGVLRDTFAMVHWEGGTRAVEDVLKAGVNAIIAWGGEEMVRSYRERLGIATRLFEYGPKISMQVVFRAALASADLADVGRRVACDICRWDQAACASPQNLFVQRGADVPPLLDAIAAALEAHPVPRGRLTPDEEVEILKETFRGRVTTLTEGGAERRGRDYYLHYDPHPGLRPSALNRTLILKPFTDVDELAAHLQPNAFFLQSCSYLADGADRDALLAALGRVGVTRFAPLGTIMDGMVGAPHDGRHGLRELVRLVPDESGWDPVAFVNEAIATVPFYRDARGGRPVRRLAEMPLLTAADLAAHPLSRSSAFLREGPHGGRIFASGGTTGKPKFVLFEPEEFAASAAMLAHSFHLRGLGRGDVVANLFVAGNMWSSFLAVDRALEQVGALQLPIGGLADAHDVLATLESFAPRAVFGLPSLLCGLCNETRAAGRRVRVPMVFYAGEHLGLQARQLLAEVWGTTEFCSAGYASVDAGPIGYQCPHCGEGEHHLFADQVLLELVDGEAVVTSRARRAMPVIRLRTGDHVTWVEGTCPCGCADPRFVLHGRCDGQMNVWACRVMLADVEAALQRAAIAAPIFQVVLEETVRDGRVAEMMRLRLEVADPAAVTPAAVARLHAAFHELAQDVRETRAVAFVAEHLLVEPLAAGAIERVARTGKVRLVVDRRR
jgi:phenylacetate-CoA ligase